MAVLEAVVSVVMDFAKADLQQEPLEEDFLVGNVKEALESVESVHKADLEVHHVEDLVVVTEEVLVVTDKDQIVAQMSKSLLVDISIE